MYASQSFKTKKALKEAVASGRKIGVFEPGIGNSPTDGKACIEGPNYGMHTWYASIVLKDGLIISVK